MFFEKAVFMFAKFYFKLLFVFSVVCFSLTQLNATSLAYIASTNNEINSESELSIIFSEYQKNSLEIQKLSLTTMYSLLDYGIKHNENLLELLYEVVIYISKENFSISIEGTDLDILRDSYVLGDTVIDAIIPENKVEKILGNISETKEIKIILHEEHKDHITDLGDLYLQKEFGFKKIENRTLDAIYGIKVAQLGIKFPVKTIIMKEEGKAQVIASKMKKTIVIDKISYRE